jgi:hypothetical protein
VSSAFDFEVFISDEMASSLVRLSRLSRECKSSDVKPEQLHQLPLHACMAWPELSPFCHLTIWKFFNRICNANIYVMSLFQLYKPLLYKQS